MNKEYPSHYRLSRMDERVMLLLCLIIFNIGVKAQISDSFTDGNFSENPPWTGETGQFMVNTSQQLQLNSSGEGIAYLSTGVPMPFPAEWRFWIKLSFSPSSNNYARVYLASNQSDLTGPLEGYFLQFGEAGSLDAVELFRQQGNTLTSVCRGADGMISSSFATSIKVIRQETGQWMVYADPEGGSAYQLLATGTDHQINELSHMGVLCKFTSSYATKMYFDDFYAGPVQIDLTPPEWLSLSPVSDTLLALRFSEPLDPVSATLPQHFSLHPELGNPESVRQPSPDSLLLSFSSSFLSDQVYTLTIHGIKDLSGNETGILSRSFSFYTAQPFDILIHEIMADPYPPAGLPEYEYVELFNRSNHPINLTGWTFHMGSSQKTMPALTLESGKYLILAHQDAGPFFTPLGPFAGFSSFSLTNTGQSLSLSEPSGKVISWVDYSDVWYGNSPKKEGGWSLEMVSASHPCIQTENWLPSVDIRGGSPGLENSVQSFFADTIPPSLLSIYPLDSVTLELRFSEPLGAASILNSGTFSISGGLPELSSVQAADYRNQSFQILLNQALQKGVLYQLITQEAIEDCTGNILPAGVSMFFGLPSEPNASDVIINEILTNPPETGSDYIELLNHSEWVFDLSSLALTYQSLTSSGTPKTIFLPARLMLPGEYYCLTRNPQTLLSQYFTPFPTRVIACNNLPDFASDSGLVFIHRKENPSLETDRLKYSSDMHFSILKDQDGVSLERINPGRSPADPTNWTSASEASGFGTPAAQNSQYAVHPASSGILTVSPEIFSPDGDGTDDLAHICITPPSEGYLVNLSIFDTQGRLIRRLAQNFSLGKEATLSWDGSRDNRSKAATGLYVVLCELYDLSGNQEFLKATLALGISL